MMSIIINIVTDSSDELARGGAALLVWTLWCGSSSTVASPQEVREALQSKGKIIIMRPHDEGMMMRATILLEVLGYFC